MERKILYKTAPDKTETGRVNNQVLIAAWMAADRAQSKGERYVGY